ncbi:gamma-glutamylcyclotransferase [Nocardiopsis sp. CNT312]|uniref:allophanate hydrolase-related protein n=1 Tax=Nocardiopsis sp. CNT312 TaxID=1137268 RepID=UPI0004BB7BFC|nr:gamma-glutamylcyclotransferase [Nocardiopsis sp. CNT312]
MTTVRMFVNGQAMSGGEISHALEGARFLGPAETAPRYRFYSVRDEFPGLHPVGEGGHRVPGELYEVEYERLRDRLLPEEPPELELGVVELADGSGSLAMRMRAGALKAPGVADISDRGGWRSHLERRNAQ